MSHLAETILSAAQALPEGTLLCTKEFLHLGSRASVDQTFSRLARTGKLMRIGRGRYAAPVASRFGNRPPSTQTVIREIESISGETIVANGAAEANALGLTTQVPTREVFLTSGRSRTLQLGKRTVALKHAHQRQLVLGKRPAGSAIRALFWLGSEQAPAALQILRSKLPAAEWHAMRSVRAVLPDWLARAVSEVSEHA